MGKNEIVFDSMNLEPRLLEAICLHESNSATLFAWQLFPSMNYMIALFAWKYCTPHTLKCTKQTKHSEK